MIKINIVHPLWALSGKIIKPIIIQLQFSTRTKKLKHTVKDDRHSHTSICICMYIYMHTCTMYIYVYISSFCVLCVYIYTQMLIYIYSRTVCVCSYIVIKLPDFYLRIRQGSPVVILFLTLRRINSVKQCMELRRASKKWVKQQEAGCLMF